MKSKFLLLVLCCFCVGIANVKAEAIEVNLNLGDWYEDGEFVISCGQISSSIVPDMVLQPGNSVMYENMIINCVPENKEIEMKPGDIFIDGDLIVACVYSNDINTYPNLILNRTEILLHENYRLSCND